MDVPNKVRRTRLFRNLHDAREYFFRNLHDAREYSRWIKRSYGPPSPQRVKQAVLARNALPGAVWVETGTFLGETTEFLASMSPTVYSIEPEPTLASEATEHFKDRPHVTIIQGLSEGALPELLPTLSGDINFWLDGHFSEGITFQGPKDTPILDELECIRDNIKNFGNVRIMIDDVRCFNPTVPDYSSYPSLAMVLEALENMGLTWHIEHDLLIAQSQESRKSCPRM